MELYASAAPQPGDWVPGEDSVGYRRANSARAFTSRRREKLRWWCVSVDPCIRESRVTVSCWCQRTTRSLEAGRPCHEATACPVDPLPLAISRACCLRPAARCHASGHACGRHTLDQRVPDTGFGVPGHRDPDATSAAGSLSCAGDVAFGSPRRSRACRYRSREFPRARSPTRARIEARSRDHPGHYGHQHTSACRRRPPRSRVRRSQRGERRRCRLRLARAGRREAKFRQRRHGTAARAPACRPTR